jgi:hypothetical protein
MRLFSCDACGQTLFFENNVCERSGHELGYSPDKMSLLTLECDGEVLRPLNGSDSYVYCGNAAHGVCNWLIPAPAERGELCMPA